MHILSYINALICTFSGIYTDIVIYLGQSDLMDAVDEKLNGTPVMEIDEPVSVRDRACLSVYLLLSIRRKDVNTW